MMPTVEINMEHNHRTSRETCHQKSVKKIRVIILCYFIGSFVSHFWSCDKAKDRIPLSQAGNA